MLTSADKVGGSKKGQKKAKKSVTSSHIFSSCQLALLIQISKYCFLTG